jgi:hypothetical protein
MIMDANISEANERWAGTREQTLQQLDDVETKLSCAVRRDRKSRKYVFRSLAARPRSPSGLAPAAL